MDGLISKNAAISVAESHWARLGGGMPEGPSDEAILDTIEAISAGLRALEPAPDLMAELVEALETAHECLLWCAREGRMASPSLSRYPERWVDNLAAVLAKIKEPQAKAKAYDIAAGDMETVRLIQPAWWR